MLDAGTISPSLFCDCRVLLRGRMISSPTVDGAMVAARFRSTGQVETIPWREANSLPYRGVP